MENGIFLLDKASGLSSAAELTKLKKKLNLKKVGHAGTLDPMATGLLVCLVNSATRLASFAEKGRKGYSGIIRFGQETSTDDIQGEVTASTDKLPTLPEIKAAIVNFTGQFAQTPPAVSAVKISGERAYKIARRGETPEIKARQVTVYKYEIRSFDDRELSFYIECSPGTYIRAIARDLGRALGSLGCLASLRREVSYPFNVNQAKRSEQLSLNDLLPWTALFPDIKHLLLDSSDARRILNGDLRNLGRRINDIVREQHSELPDRLIYFEERAGKPLGLLSNNHGQWEITVNLN